MLKRVLMASCPIFFENGIKKHIALCSWDTTVWKNSNRDDNDFLRTQKYFSPYLTAYKQMWEHWQMSYSHFRRYVVKNYLFISNSYSRSQGERWWIFNESRSSEVNIQHYMTLFTNTEVNNCFVFSTQWNSKPHVGYLFCIKGKKLAWGDRCYPEFE